MFILALVGIGALGLLALVAKWALSQPQDAIDGALRLVAGTIAGGLIALWVVVAAVSPLIDGQVSRGAPLTDTPNTAQLRQFARDTVANAPVSVDLAAGIGAGLGFFLSLASVSSYRRTT